jgi:hypothetical protein
MGIPKRRSQGSAAATKSPRLARRRDTATATGTLVGSCLLRRRRSRIASSSRSAPTARARGPRPPPDSSGHDHRHGRAHRTP